MGPFCCLFSLAALGFSAAEPAFQPQGEPAARLGLLRERLVNGQVPAITPEFVLADIALRPDYPRRFNEYSGDVSGRYMGALACVPLRGVALDAIVAEALTYQKADGRFGNDSLEFTPEKVGFDHMALLWGNGRLLVGLLEYHSTKPDPAALEASRRLGDFLRAAYAGCANEQVAQRVKELGAAGMICFTQLIEGLVMLADATGDKTYLDTAESIIPWFQQDRGQQHSHGYLSTLRGILLLHEATGKPEQLTLVEDLYASLVNSPDYLVYGGVMEYFGGKGDRDEGCSEADFLRLSLQLWRVTDKPEYFDKAEHCLMNQFSASQFPNGDFGHHAYNARGVFPVVGEGRAWWCCTWHGLRAYRDVLDSVVTEKDGLVRINLFTDGEWTGGDRGLEMEFGSPSIEVPPLRLTVTEAPTDGLRLAIRKPAWCKEVSLFTEAGTSISTTDEGGYLVLSRPLQQGERIRAACLPNVRIVKRDGTSFAPEQLTDQPVEGVLFYGPWMLGACGAENPQFYGEPWAGNRILLPAAVSNDVFRPIAGQVLDKAIEQPSAHVKATYTHEGFPGTYDVFLQPLAERTLYETQPFVVWLNYCAAP